MYSNIHHPRRVCRSFCPPLFNSACSDVGFLAVLPHSLALPRFRISLFLACCLRSLSLLSPLSFVWYSVCLCPLLLLPEILFLRRDAIPQRPHRVQSLDRAVFADDRPQRVATILGLHHRHRRPGNRVSLLCPSLRHPKEAVYAVVCHSPKVDGIWCTCVLTLRVLEAQNSFKGPHTQPISQVLSETGGWYKVKPFSANCGFTLGPAENIDQLGKYVVNCRAWNSDMKIDHRTHNTRRRVA